MNIQDFSAGVVPQANGVWRSAQSSPISYPGDGNLECYLIEESSFWFQHRNQVITELVRRFAPSDVFLDVGGGNGFVAAAIQTAGFDVALLEPGTTGCQNAIRRGVRNVINATLEDAQIRDNSIGAIGIFDVMEHIEDDDGFLRQLHCVLKPNGHLFVTVPAFGALWSFEDEHAGHFRRYTISSARRVLKKSGFQVLFASYLFQPLAFPILLCRSIPSAVRWRKSVATEITAREHSLPKSLIGSVIRRGLQRELLRIRRLRAQWFGSSCVIVASKVVDQESGYQLNQ